MSFAAPVENSFFKELPTLRKQMKFTKQTAGLKKISAPRLL